jgi:hypothetical protein
MVLAMDQRRFGRALMIFGALGAVGILLGALDAALGDAPLWKVLLYMFSGGSMAVAAFMGYREWKRSPVDE